MEDGVFTEVNDLVLVDSSSLSVVEDPDRGPKRLRLIRFNDSTRGSRVELNETADREGGKLAEKDPNDARVEFLLVRLQDLLHGFERE